MATARAIALGVAGTGTPRNLPEPADIIMAKVALNQDRAQEMRSAFVYHQYMLIRFKRGNGKLAREEQRQGIHYFPRRKASKELTPLHLGKYEKSGNGSLSTTKARIPEYKGVDTSMAGLRTAWQIPLTNDKDTRDGMSEDPYAVEMRRDAGEILFSPRRKKRTIVAPRFTASHSSPRGSALVDCDDDDASCWAGEVLVDVHEHQPVLVTSWLAKSIPKTVQILLSTQPKATSGIQSGVQEIRRRVVVSGELWERIRGARPIHL